MGQAMAIARTPRATWAGQIDALPDGCDRLDCTGERSCQRRIREYLRMQYRIAARREARRAPGAAAGTP